MRRLCAGRGGARLAGRGLKEVQGAEPEAASREWPHLEARLHPIHSCVRLILSDPTSNLLSPFPAKRR